MLLFVIGVVVATIVHQLLGMFWYSTFFGTAWRKALNKDGEEFSADGYVLGYVFSTLAALIIAVGLGLAFHYLGVSTVWEAIGVSLAISLFFNMTTFLTHTPFSGIWRVAFIDFGYDVVNYVLMGTIIFLFT